MSSKEHEPGTTPEGEATPYYKAARFTRQRTAWEAYSKLQRTIFRADCDLSCYRLQLDRAWHVAVLGEPPSDDVAARLDPLLSAGVPSTLPPGVVSVLQARRASAVASGSPWIERHYRPNK